jgi:hypothetical protein
MEFIKTYVFTEVYENLAQPVGGERRRSAEKFAGPAMQLIVL